MVELPDRATLERLIEQLYLYASQTKRERDLLNAGVESLVKLRAVANEWIMAPKGDLAELPAHLFSMLLPFLDVAKAENYLQFTFQHGDRDEMMGHFVVCRPHHSPDKLYKEAVAEADQLRADNAELKGQVIDARRDALREVAYQASLPGIPIAALRNVIDAMIQAEDDAEVRLSREREEEMDREEAGRHDG